ncbi:MAG TPA: DEAD/DEAH box helicase [Steroidobacteraceae bacterium]|nr:DEAD/DEAH box helicase [Steroidobacteraceae bacterium]
MTFADLGLKPELLRAVAEKGYTDPTPIQAQAIPAVLSGSDVLAGAQTGTGKTAAFVLPILQKLNAVSGRLPRALVLTPTRELAAQVAESARSYGKFAGLRTVVVFGGVSLQPQIKALQSGCDLLVATPGRLLDLVEQRALELGAVQCLVLDEADRMLDMGFIHAIRRIIKLLPAQRQNLMFSATYSDDIRQLAERILRRPVNIEVAPRNATADRVEQQVYRVHKEHKRHLLAHLIDEGNWHQVLVFTRTKHGANRLSQQLEGRGIRASAIHGNKSQNARTRALADFKSGEITALVATEVAARGLDIKDLPHVVNFELPNVPEDYVHRIGRTARAGGTGSAVSLVSPDETPLLRDIEKLLRRSLPVTPLPQFSVTSSPTSREDSERDEESHDGESGDQQRQSAGGGQHRPTHGGQHRPAHGGQHHGSGGGQRHGSGGGQRHGSGAGQRHSSGGGQRHGSGGGQPGRPSQGTRRFSSGAGQNRGRGRFSEQR